MTGVLGGLRVGTVRENPQLFSDAFGVSQQGAQQLWDGGSAGEDLALADIGEPDLIMTGVRSFDVKAYDDLYAGFVDLGWKNDVRISGNIPEYNRSTDNTSNGYNFLYGTPSTAYSPFAGSPFNATSPYGGTPLIRGVAWLPTISTFGHEGRMPPLVNDNRADAQFPSGYYLTPTTGLLPAGARTTSGISSPTSATTPTNINRLRRVFDTWSTDYTDGAVARDRPGHGDGLGPPFSPPVYPSYPPPYPAPLKGIQIQIRVVDPTNQRIKQVTIRHDFTDRL